jgi:hypothetical protein
MRALTLTATGGLEPLAPGDVPAPAIAAPEKIRVVSRCRPDGGRPAICGVTTRPTVSLDLRIEVAP